MAKLGFPGAEEMASMFRVFQKGIERDINLTKKLNPKAKS
jgi:predicted DNA-binding transcriptional regulator YafY